MEEDYLSEESSDDYIYGSIPPEEIVAAMKQIIEDEHPLAAKFIDFGICTGACDTIVDVLFAGECIFNIECGFCDMTKDTFITGQLSEFRKTLIRNMAVICRAMNIGWNVCDLCDSDESKYPRVMSVVPIHFVDRTACACWRPFTGFGWLSIYERSLERQEHVVDAMRILPSPISQEIMWQFVA